MQYIVQYADVNFKILAVIYRNCLPRPIERTTLKFCHHGISEIHRQNQLKLVYLIDGIKLGE